MLGSEKALRSWPAMCQFEIGVSSSRTNTTQYFHPNLATGNKNE